MHLERVADSVRELLSGNEILKKVMRFSDYIVYAYTALLVLSAFFSFPVVVNVLLFYLFFAVLLLAFAVKSPLALVVLFGGKVLFYLYRFVYFLVPQYEWGVQTKGSYFSWESFFGLVVCGLFLWAAISFFLRERDSRRALPYVSEDPAEPEASSSPEVPAAPATQGVICPNCSAECVVGTYSCPHCGTKF